MYNSEPIDLGTPNPPVALVEGGQTTFTMNESEANMVHYKVKFGSNGSRKIIIITDNNYCPDESKSWQQHTWKRSASSR